ncbi:MAG: hypothetical protein DRI32_08960 [Chloroflexi bacterium]|nr:MAG: hypothetical protein DRI32_08960 [Chloroflexota bacterium]
MLFTKKTYIGVNLTGSNFTYAALDSNLGLLALDGGNLDALLTFIGGQTSAFVAVNAPTRPNLGRVRALLEAEDLGTGSSPLRGAEMRMAEYELRARGIKVAATPSHPDLCPAWMRAGFRLYERLYELGFAEYPAEDSTHQVLETHPQAGFIVMAEGNLFPASALEGRLQRQAILYGAGLDIRDPMSFFEEITRFKLKQGILPLEEIYNAKEQNALLAAHTAWLTAEKPNDVTSLGDEEEGKVYLPTRKLKSKY